MSDLIKREDAVKTVIRKCSPICAWQVGTQQYPDCVVAEINALPSADRPHGEWVGLHECSVCGKQVIDFIDGWVEGIEYLPNFCPNCGARMVKGGDTE